MEVGRNEPLNGQAREANNDNAAAAAPAAAAVGTVRSALADPLHPSRMLLSTQELVWAQSIKVAIEQNKEIDNLADFWYAQLALIERANLEGALERASRMQSFRQEYKIHDTFEEACRSLKQLCKLFPGVFLSFSYNEMDGNYCLVYDLAAFDLRELKNFELQQAGMKGAYYLCIALTPDMEAIRKGVIFVAECEGFDWKKNATFAFFQRGWLELLGAFPFQFQKLKYFHTGFFMNMINALKKKILPRSITDKIEAGCQFEGGRLSGVYLVPNLKKATERLLSRTEYTAGIRFMNQKGFQLLPVPDQP